MPRISLCGTCLPLGRSARYGCFWSHYKMMSLLLRHWNRYKMPAIFQTTLSGAFSWMKMYEFPLKIHWSLFLRVHWNILALAQIMAWHRPGDKPLSAPMLFSLLTYICVARPQWINWAMHACICTWQCYRSKRLKSLLFIHVDEGESRLLHSTKGDHSTKEIFPIITRLIY